MSDIVLHQWVVSPFCGKVRRLLDIKGLAYRTVEYNGLRVPKAARLSKVGKLPVLDIDGQRLTDSRLIAAYLEARYPEPSLTPKDPRLQAQMQLYQDWADESLYWYNFYFRLCYDDAWDKTATFFAEGRPAFEKFLIYRLGRKQYFSQLRGQGLGRVPKPQVEARFLLLLDQLEVILEQQPWLVGEHQTLADVAVASQLHEIKRTSHLAGELIKRSAVANWMDHH